MTTFVVYREDASGDLLDVEYYDTGACMTGALSIDGIFSSREAGGQKTPDAEQYLSWGKAPCALSNVEYAVYCGWCGHPMNEEAHNKEAMV